MYIYIYTYYCIKYQLDQINCAVRPQFVLWCFTIPIRKPYSTLLYFTCKQKNTRIHVHVWSSLSLLLLSRCHGYMKPPSGLSPAVQVGGLCSLSLPFRGHSETEQHPDGTKYVTNISFRHQPSKHRAHMTCTLSSCFCPRGL